MIKERYGKVVKGLGGLYETRISEDGRVERLVCRAKGVLRRDDEKLLVGDEVRILNGIFENFTGRVSQVDPVTKRVTVVVEMLNRATNVELALDEVVRVEI